MDWTFRFGGIRIIFNLIIIPPMSKQKISIPKIVFQSLTKETGTLNNRVLTESVEVDQINNSYFKDCELPKLTLRNGSFLGDFAFKQCIIDELELINFTGTKLQIDGGKFKKITISIEEPVTGFNELEELQITNVTSEFDLTINYLTVAKFIDINACKIRTINVRSTKALKLNLTLNTVESQAIFTGVETKEPSQFSGTFKTIHFQGSKFIAALYFISAKIDECITYNNGLIKTLYVSKGSINRLKLRNVQIETLTIQESNITRLNILKPENLELLQVIGKTTINYFRFVGGIHIGDATLNFSIDKLICNTFIVEQLFNRNSFALSNCEIGNRLSIDSSNLKINGESKASFENVILRNCELISFYRTNILGTQFFNVQWNSDYRLDKMKPFLKGKSKDFKLNHYWLIKESYRQLKIVSIENSNKIDANFFQSGELDIYYDILVLRTFQSVRNFIRHSGDLLILSISKYLGGYGLKVWRPILGWIGIHGFLFYFLLKKIDFGIYFNIKNYDCESTLKGLKLFILLLSPVHGTEYYGVNFSGSITDYVIRIASGFFLYYIIRASRKFIFSA
jgi:hypothetical protein